MTKHDAKAAFSWSAPATAARRMFPIAGEARGAPPGAPAVVEAKRWSRNVPPSAVLTLASFLAFALQAPSFPGAFLQRYGFDLFTGWLINAALLTIVVDASRGAISRWFVAIPLLFYALYSFNVWQQNANIEFVAYQLSRSNPGKVFDLDPSKNSLVLPAGDSFVADHDIAKVYAKSGYYKPDEYVSYQAIPTDRIAGYLANNPSGVQIESVYVDRVLQRNVRILKTAERLPSPPITVITREDPGDGSRNGSIGIQTTTLVLQGRVMGSFRAGFVQKLPPFPVLSVGCGPAADDAEGGRSCHAAIVTRRLEIESRPESIDRTLYDTPVSVLLGVKKRKPDELTHFRGPEGERPRPGTGEDEAFEALNEALDGRGALFPPGAAAVLAGSRARLAPLAGRMAKRFIELNQSAAPDFVGRREQLELLVVALAALGPADFAAVQDSLADLASDPGFPDRFPVLYLRLADTRSRLYAIYRDRFLAPGASPTGKLLAALAVCRMRQADSELVAAMKADFGSDAAAAGENYQAALFVALMNLGQEKAAPLPSGSKALQKWYAAVAAGQGRTDVGPNNCMPMEWPFDRAAPPIMAPSLRWTGQQWSVAPPT